MNFILNIGLDVNATSQIAAHVALEIVKANDFVVNTHSVVQSDTEPTLVVDVVFPGANALLCLQAFHQIANDLQQDCIAVYRPELERGALIGPRAEKWGKFNPEFFFCLNGTRLAEPVLKAA